MQTSVEFFSGYAVAKTGQDGARRYFDPNAGRFTESRYHADRAWAERVAARQGGHVVEIWATSYPVRHFER